MGSKVMVVDDSLMVRQQVGRALAQAGFAVIEAKDGLDGLEKIKMTPDLALIVCDVNMPRMSGLELLEAVRGEEGLSHIPFVMLTTEGQAERIQRAKALGAKAWILKPFKPELLIAAVTKLTAAAA